MRTFRARTLPFDPPWPAVFWNPLSGPRLVPNPGKEPRGPVLLHPDRLMDPVDWRDRKLVFVSWGVDLFAEPVPEQFLFDLLDRVLNSGGQVFVALTADTPRAFTVVRRFVFSRGRLFTNFWLGTPVLGQPSDQARLAPLVQTPVAGRFAWCLPPGPATLSPWLEGGLQWVTAPAGMCPANLEAVAGECSAAGVPFWRPDAPAFPRLWEEFFAREAGRRTSAKS
jgi:protein gp37